jgi:iron(III) transport system ATP-binding protein
MILLGGRDVSQAPPAQRDFGIVFQSYALFPNLTVRDNVGYGLVNRGDARAAVKARVDELLALVGLPEQAEKYPVQLSGGQQQRVALARALAPSPGLLLLDEPLSALDARVRVRLRDEVKALQRRLGVTTIMVTHDQEEALGMADRIVVMDAGSIEQIGTPVEVYRHPATAFVADFVGAMNLIEGIVETNGVRIGSTTLRASVPNGAVAGARVKLGIRPEEVRVSVNGSAGPNVLDATIAGQQFHGAFDRLTLESDSLHAIFANVTAQSGLKLTPGTRLRIELPADALRVFPSA